jgi:hypothetical protein
MVSAPQKGVAFLTNDVFEKEFSVAGKDSAVGAGHVAELVGIEGGVVSGVINLESSGA